MSSELANTSQDSPRPVQDRSLWLVPYRRNPCFVGRESELERLRASLTRNAAAALGPIQAISGTVGIGKTHAAVEYAYRHRDDYEAVFFVRAGSEAEIRGGFGEIGRRLGCGDSQKQEDVIASVRGWLEENTGWLLIVDDTDELTKAYLPVNHGGHVLLTTRERAFAVLGIPHPFHMEALTPEDAVSFLLKRTEREEVCVGEELEAAVCLSEELGFLPLALEQAGVYVREKQARFQSYLASYRERSHDSLQPAATTQSLSFSEVEETSPVSADVLRASAFLGPSEIPLEFLRKGAVDLGPLLADASADATDDRLIGELLEPLVRYSLISLDVARQSYSVHRLVRQVTKAGMKQADHRMWAERIVSALDKTFPDAEFETRPLCDQLVPHVQSAETLIDELALKLDSGRLFHQAGLYLRYRAHYAAAEPLYLRDLDITEKALGKDHPEVTRSLNSLGVLYSAQRRYAEAEPIYLRCLEVTEKALGKDHPSLALTLNNLGVLYRDQGRYEEAERLYLRDLEIKEKALGKDHTSLAQTLSNLGVLYRDQGRYEETERLYLHSLEILEKALGKDCPPVTPTLNNLGNLYRKQGRYAEAESLYLRCLGILEKALGKDHPWYVPIVKNYSRLLRDTGREHEAVELEAGSGSSMVDSSRSP